MTDFYRRRSKIFLTYRNFLKGHSSGKQLTLKLSIFHVKFDLVFLTLRKEATTGENLGSKKIESMSAHLMTPRHPSKYSFSKVKSILFRAEKTY